MKEKSIPEVKFSTEDAWKRAIGELVLRVRKFQEIEQALVQAKENPEAKAKVETLLKELGDFSQKAVFQQRLNEVEPPEATVQNSESNNSSVSPPAQKTDVLLLRNWLLGDIYR